MQVSVETTTGLERRMTVEIPKERIDSEVLTRLKSLSGKAKINGFRPGKIPFEVIKKKFGGRVEQEVLGEIIQSSFAEAIDQEKLRPAGMPHIETKDADNKEHIGYTATFEVYPVVSLSATNEIEIEQPEVSIADSDIDEMIDVIRKQHATWAEVERTSQDGDQVTVDYEGFMDDVAFEGGKGSNVPIEIGSKRMIPGFEEQLVELSKDQETTISVTFPETYQAKDLAGKVATFNLKVLKVEESSLPAVDDEFAATMGVSEGGISVFRDQVKGNMEREAKNSIDTNLKQQVMDKLLEYNQFDLPKSLVDNEIQALLEQQKQMPGQNNGDISSDIFEEQARRRVSLGLILSEVVKQNDLKVAPSKLREILEGIAAGYDSPEEVMKHYYGDRQRLAEIENYALEKEVVDWVVKQAKVSTKSVTFNDLMNRDQGTAT